MKSATVLAVLAIGLLSPLTHERLDQPQDKKKTDKPKALPSPPAGKKSRQLPPVLEPARSLVERRDLHQQFRSRHPIEGTYRLKYMMTPGGRIAKGSRGYLVVGQRHLSLHLYAPSASRNKANVQSVFRKFRIVGDKIVANTLLGHRSKDNGDFSLEPIGYRAQQKFVLTGAVLRIYRSLDEYLEFERIE